MSGVVISVGAEFRWAFHAARAAQDAGLLQQFITARSNPAAYGIEDRYVRYFTLPRYAGAAFRRIGPLRFLAPWQLITDNTFDLQAALSLPKSRIFHGWNSYSLLPMLRAKQRGTITIVDRPSLHPMFELQALIKAHETHGYPLPRAGIRWQTAKEVRELNMADWVVVCSSLGVETMVSHGVDPGKLRVVPFGVDSSHFTPGEKEDSTYRVLFVGGLRYRKGLPDLLAAYQEIESPGTELVIVGGVPEPGMEQILSRVPPSVRIVGSVHPNELPAYYRNASVLVLPSHAEGLGMVVLEAMACGTPVVVTDMVGARDLISDGNAGLVVPTGDVAALAAALQRLHNEPDWRRALGENARKIAVENSWANYGRKIVDLYRSLLSEEETVEGGIFPDLPKARH